jgi:hypothetical protein
MRRVEIGLVDLKENRKFRGEEIRRKLRKTRFGINREN